MAMEFVSGLIAEDTEVNVHTLITKDKDRSPEAELILLDGGASHDVYVCNPGDDIVGKP